MTESDGDHDQDINYRAAMTRMPSAINHETVDWWVKHGFAIERKQILGGESSTTSSKFVEVALKAVSPKAKKVYEEMPDKFRPTDVAEKLKIKTQNASKYVKELEEVYLLSEVDEGGKRERVMRKMTESEQGEDETEESNCELGEPPKPDAVRWKFPNSVNPERWFYSSNSEHGSELDNPREALWSETTNQEAVEEVAENLIEFGETELEREEISEDFKRGHIKAVKTFRDNLLEVFSR